MSIPGQSILHDLQRGIPGRRFRKHYDAAHHKGNERSVIYRIIRFVLALVAVVIGIVLTVTPGPAVVFFALAGALLATESRRLAAALDWTEVSLRAGGRRAIRTWKSLGWFGRSVVVLVAALGTIAFFALVVWFYFFR